MSPARAARRGRLRALASSWLVLLVLSLAGCWPAPGFGPDRTAHNPFETTISPATVGSLEQLWSARLDTALVGPPVVVGDAVYADDGPRLHRLDAATGAHRWKAGFELPPYPIHYEMGSPFVVGHRVLVGWGGPHGPGFDNGRWVTQWLDPATGAVVEEGPPGGQVQAVRGDRVLSTRQVQVPSSPEPHTALVVADGDRGSWSGLLGLRASVTLGRDQVYAAVGPSPEAPAGAVSAFPVSGGRSDCGPSPDLPYACPIWTTPIEGVSGANPPVLGNGGTTLFVVAGTGPEGRGMLHALDTATGAVRWSVDVGSRGAYTPALADGRLYVPTASGRFVVVSAQGCGAPTCQPLWAGLTPGGATRQQPAVAGGVVFVTAFDTLNGFVYAFDAAGCGQPTCTSSWWTWLDGEPTGPPAVSGGRLFVTTGHQEVIAYG